MRRGLGRGRGKGYYNIIPRDPGVHSMSAKGMKQPQKIPPKLMNQTTQRLPDLANFYDSLWQKNNGVFYRGYAKIDDEKVGMGSGVLGAGRYYAWDRGVAKAFSEIASEEKGGSPRIEETTLPRDLKLLDAQSKTMIDLKRSLGVEPFEKVGDPLFARVLTAEIKKRGEYDGVISDDKFDGILIFEKDKPNSSV